MVEEFKAIVIKDNGGDSIVISRYDDGADEDFVKVSAAVVCNYFTAEGAAKFAEALLKAAGRSLPAPAPAPAKASATGDAAGALAWWQVARDAMDKARAALGEP
jgi:hypothetical protein